MSTGRYSTWLDEREQSAYGSLEGGHTWPRKEWQRKARDTRSDTHARPHACCSRASDRHRATSYRWGTADLARTVQRYKTVLGMPVSAIDMRRVLYAIATCTRTWHTIVLFRASALLIPTSSACGSLSVPCHLSCKRPEALELSLMVAHTRPVPTYRAAGDHINACMRPCADSD